MAAVDVEARKHLPQVCALSYARYGAQFQSLFSRNMARRCSSDVPPSLTESRR